MRMNFSVCPRASLITRGILACFLFIFATSLFADNVNDSELKKDKPPCDKCDEDCPDKTSGDPFQLDSGEFYWRKTFLKSPNDRLLQFTVHYSTYSDAEGPLGSGWNHNFQYRITKTEDGGYALRMPQRKTVYFELSSGNEYKPKDTSRDRLFTESGGVLRLHTAQNLDYLFDSGGKLVEVASPWSAKKLVLTYDANGQREVIGIPRSSRLTNAVVTARDWRLLKVEEQTTSNTPTGRRFEFTYDETGHLEKVQSEPGSRRVQFGYKSPSGVLETITDEVGDVYATTYYDDPADVGKSYWRYMKTFVGQGCSDCTLRTNYYLNSPYGEQQSKLIKQTEGAGAEGEQIDVTYNTNSTSITYKIKNTSTGAIVRTRTEIVNFVSDVYGGYRVSGRTITFGSGLTYKVSYAYDPSNGRILKRTGANGGTVDYTYDSKGNITGEAHAISPTSKKVISRQFDSANNAIREEVYLSEEPTVKFITERTYNSAHQVTMERRQHANGTWVMRTYDYYTSGASAGLLWKETDPLNHVIEKEYTTVADAPAPVGLLKREFDPANPDQQTIFGYDAVGNRISRIDPLGRTTTFQFDEKGRLLKQTQPDGHELINTYVGSNLVETKNGNSTYGYRVKRTQFNGLNQPIRHIRVNAQGQEEILEEYQFDSADNVLVKTNALGQSFYYEYNAIGLQTKLKRPYEGQATSDTAYAYDAAGRLVGVTDALGIVTETRYDYLDRIVAKIEAKGKPEERSALFTYDANSNKTLAQYNDASGSVVARTRYYYDRLDRQVAVNWNPANASPDEDGGRELPKKLEYDGCGNLTAQIDARGSRTEYDYDAYHRLILTRYPDRSNYTNGNDTVIIYDGVGNVVQAIDGRGIRHFRRYDSMNRLTVESIPTTVDLGSNWWETPGNVLKQVTYNVFGESATTTTANGLETSTYDAYGRVATHTDGAGLTVTYVYNPLDQPLEIQYPPVGANPATKVVITYTPYNGRLIESTKDRSGGVSTLHYDILFRNDRVRSPLNQPGGPEEVTTFDALGRARSVTDEGGHATVTAYTIFNEPLSVTYPDHSPANPRIKSMSYDVFGHVLTEGGTEYPAFYTYDSAGNLITMTTQYGGSNANQTTTWTFDSRNRVKRKTASNNSYYEYEYDEVGNIDSRLDAKGQITSYEYNLYNQPELVDYSSDSDVSFQYDAFGRRLSMSDGSRSGGPSAEWEYDGAGRVSSYKQHAADRKITYGYTAEGMRTFMNVEKISVPGNPWHIDYGYDSASRLSSIADNRAGGNPFTYIWDSKADLVKELIMPSGAKQLKNYDALARLTEIKAVASGGGTMNRYAYTYTPGGQRSQVTLADESSISYTYDERRQVSTASKDLDPNYNYAYTFDKSGNWLSGSVGQIGSAPAEKAFAVNGVNQYSEISVGTTTLTQVYDVNGNLTSDGSRAFAWDQENRLLNVDSGAGCLYDGLGRRVAKGSMRFLYDGSLLIAEIDGAGEYSRTITRGLDLANSFERAGGIGGVLGSTSSTSAFYFYDGNGNVADVIDGSNTVRAHYEYDPFGNKTAQTGVDVNQPFQWSTKEFDLDTGLSYFGSRYYFPQTGRWLNPDPIGEQGSRNLYLAFNNDPVNRIDPFGNESAAALIVNTTKSLFQGAGFDTARELFRMPLVWLPGAPIFRLVIGISVNALLCCHPEDGSEGMFAQATISLEGYLQWGWHWKNDVRGNRFNGGDADTVVGKVEAQTPEPNMGYKERNAHAEFGALPKCPPKNVPFEWIEFSLNVFLRGSAGVGFGGAQFNASAPLHKYSTIGSVVEEMWANKQVSLAGGIVGASIDFGINGNVGFKFTVY